MAKCPKQTSSPTTTTTTNEPWFTSYLSRGDLRQFVTANTKHKKTIWTAFIWRMVAFLQMYNSWHTPVFSTAPPPPPLPPCFVFHHVRSPYYNYSLQGAFNPLWQSSIMIKWALLNPRSWTIRMRSELCSNSAPFSFLVNVEWWPGSTVALHFTVV